jgi:hypothetical protein
VSASGPTAATAPRTTQRRTAYALLAILLLGSMAALLSRRELWPFSPYPMYAWVERSPAVVRYDLVGVTAGGEEIRIQATRSLWPFDDARLIAALIEIWRRDREDVDDALAFLLGLYEQRRLERQTGLPGLERLRFYKSRWKHFDPEARDVDAPPLRLVLFEARAGP